MQIVESAWARCRRTKPKEGRCSERSRPTDTESRRTPALAVPTSRFSMSEMSAVREMLGGRALALADAQLAAVVTDLQVNEGQYIDVERCAAVGTPRTECRT